MTVEIISRRAAEELKKSEFPENSAVISFYTPNGRRALGDMPVDYSGVCDRTFAVGIPDIDRECLEDYGYTEESFLLEADAVAEFILGAVSDGRRIICQCDYGQSRSAACAAAILQFYEKRGIDVFADYRYYPNQLVYHKIFDALVRNARDKRNGGI